MKIFNGPIPFSRSGHQLAYAGGWERDVQWRDNDTFEDTLTFLSFERGRSAAHACFERRSTGTQVYVFLTDLADMIKHMKDGKVHGRFAFCKRGQNYGCKMFFPS